MISTKKLSTKYILYKDGNYHILVEIDVNKKITIINKRGNRFQKAGELKEFVFDGSKPETLRAIGELLVEASNIDYIK